VRQENIKFGVCLDYIASKTLSQKNEKEKERKRKMKEEREEGEEWEKGEEEEHRKTSTIHF
jgi:ssDNA-binding Zn-finger/Zn-ribbon topoisomerase 1